MTENATDFSAEKAPENPTDSMQSIGWWVRERVLPFIEPSVKVSKPAPKPHVVIRRKRDYWIAERDDWIILCVKLGLDVKEIRDLSYSFPRPLTTLQQIYDRIKWLNMEKYYKRKDKKRSGAHNQNIIFAFTKIAGQALQHGYRVTDVLRDAAPEGARFRPDLMLKLDRREFMVEVQLSKIEGTRWGEKFRNYIKLYELWRRPFRCLVLIDKKEDLSKVRRTARNYLKKRGHPELNLFYFSTLEQFRNERDVIKEKVWITAWGQNVSLM